MGGAKLKAGARILKIENWKNIISTYSKPLFHLYSLNVHVVHFI